METPEMVERVARALMEVSSEPEHGHTWDSVSEEWRDNFRTHARAAIEAMREPTLAQVDAGMDRHRELGCDPLAIPASSDTPYRLWHAMIDAALTAPQSAEASPK